MITFANSGMLAALAFLAVPVLLHLMRREVAVRIEFPSIRFVKRGRLPHGGRRRLRDIIMLLTRLLALALLILAFAGPHYDPGDRSAGVPADRPGLDLFIIDVSASMGGWGSLERAVARVTEVLDAAGPGDRFALVTSAAGAQTRVAPTRDTEAVRAALAGLAPTTTAARHAEALQHIAGMLDGESAPRVLIVSDFQAGGWRLDALPALPDRVRLQLVDVGADRSRNTAILGATTRVLPDASRHVTVEIHNFEPDTITREITLTAGNRDHAQRIELPPRQTTRVAIALPLPDTLRGVATLDADAYTGDDRYWFWLGAPPPVRLLVFVPFTEEPELRNEQFFARQALTVDTDTPLTEFDVQFYDSAAFSSVNLANADALLLIGAAAYFRDRDFESLKAFVEAGGTVLATPSARVPGPLFVGLRRHGLLTTDFGGLVDTRAEGVRSAVVGWLDSAGPLKGIAANLETTDLFLFPIRRYVRLRPLGSARDLIRSEAGDSLLLTQAVGPGWFHMLAFGLGVGWSDFPLSGVFVPLLRELLGERAESERAGGILRVACGDPVTLAGGAPRAHEPAIDTTTPDVLEFAGRPVEINVPRSESEVASTALTVLREHLLPDSAASAPDAITQARIESARMLNLGIGFALFAALLFVCEGVLAAFFDRRESGHVR